MNSPKTKSSFRIADILENETKSSEKSDGQLYEETFLSSPLNLSNQFHPDLRSQFCPERVEEFYRVQKMPFVSNLHHVSPFPPVNIGDFTNFDQFHSNLLKGKY